MAFSVIGITFSSDKQKVLVIQRKDVLMWALPGGGVDPGETSEKAVAREIEEETGLQVIVKRKTAVYYPINRLTQETDVYECYQTSGDLRKSDETANVGFYPIEELPQPFFHVHQDWIRDAINFPEKTVRKPIDQVTYGKVLGYFLKNPKITIQFLYGKLKKILK